MSNRIAIIGDFIVDDYRDCSCDRISPESPSPVLIEKKNFLRAGGAANVAINYSQLGGEAHFYFLKSIKNEPSIQNEILNNLKHLKLKCNTLNSDNKTISLKKRFVVGNNQIFRIDDDCFINKNNANSLIEKLKSKINLYDSIIISDYGKGMITSDIQKIIQTAKKKSIKIIIDPFGKDWKKYKGSFLLTPNLKEFELVSGKCQNDKELISKAKKIIKELNIENLLITLGSKGMICINRNGVIDKLNALTKQVYDVTGAGDTVVSSIAFFLSKKKMSLKNSIFYANRVASIVVGKFGTSYVTKEELNKFVLKDNPKELDKNNLSEIIKSLKQENKKIVFTNGCFDIFHIGHLKYLKESKNNGDVLLVALNTDKSIKNNKGEHRPINMLKDRMEIISNLHFVDYVISFSEKTPIKLIKEIKPDTLTKGEDYKNITDIVGYGFVKSYGGSVKIIKSGKKISTTHLLKKTSL